MGATLYALIPSDAISGNYPIYSGEQLLQDSGAFFTIGTSAVWGGGSTTHTFLHSWINYFIYRKFHIRTSTNCVPLVLCLEQIP